MGQFRQRDLGSDLVSSNIRYCGFVHGMDA